MKSYKKQRKKRWMLLLLIALMALYLAGCGREEETDKGTLVQQEYSYWTL